MSDRPVTCTYSVVEQNPGHTRLSVYVGRTPGARGHAGVITLRTDEYEALRDGDRLVIELFPTGFDKDMELLEDFNRELGRVRELRAQYLSLPGAVGLPAIQISIDPVLTQAEAAAALDDRAAMHRLLPEMKELE